MLMELIEKKNKPIQTRIKLTKKEDVKMRGLMARYKAMKEKESSRYVYYIVVGDLLNDTKSY